MVKWKDIQVGDCLYDGNGKLCIIINKTNDYFTEWFRADYDYWITCQIYLGDSDIWSGYVRIS